MQISFLHPAFFALLVLIPALWFVPRKVERPVQGLLRSLLLALVVMALARPVLLTPSSERHQVVIVDRSASLSHTQRAEAEQALEQRLSQAGSQDRLTVIEVGGEVAAQGDSLRVDRAGSASSLSAALTAAAQQIPTGGNGRITLISDGLATDREWGDTVAQLIERGIAVDSVGLGQRDDDIYPSALFTVGDTRVGDTVRAYVTVVGSGDVSVVLTDREGFELARTEARIDGRDDLVLAFEPAAAGFLSVTAEVMATTGDANPGNNTVTATIAVQPPVRALYLGGRLPGGGDHLQQLVGKGFVLEPPAAPLDADFPFDQYQLVVIDDAPAQTLPAAFQQRLAAAVQKQGLGLMFAGGRGAFGEGGYDQTPVAEVLPVEFQQRSEKKEPSVALAIIIDTSGSMGVGERLDLAKQVARLSLNKLKKSDKVGVVEFYGAKSWAVPLQSLKNRGAVERAIGRMQATGATVLIPAIEEAFYGLQNVRANYKHILVISDAGVEDADFEGAIRAVAKAGITLSTVLPGSGKDNAIMSRMARIGGGRFYAVPGQFDLVELNFRKPSETRLPAYRAGLYEVAARTGTGWWGDVVTTDLPALSGYVEVQNRRGADVLLETEGSAHPLLSSWRYGLGRVTALMTEPVGPGTRSWQSWNDYGRLLARVMTRTANDGRAFDYQLVRRGERLYIDAVRTVAGAEAVPQLRLAEEGVDGDSVTFVEMAPGWFRGTVSAAARDAVQLVGDTRTGRHYLNAASRLVPETQVDPLRGLDLGRLVEVTGGADLSAGGAGVDAVDNAEALSLHKLSPWVLLLALLVYLGELLYRRWPAKH